MSEAAMLVEMAERLIADRIDDAAMRRARDGEWPADAWDAMTDMGLPLALVDERAGGFGLPSADALALARLSGQHALPLPLGETMMANHALAAAGLPLADAAGALVDGSGLEIVREASGWRLRGTVERVPWARDISTLVVADTQRTYRVGSGCTVARRSTNLASMPRDTLTVDAWCEATGPAPAFSPELAVSILRTLQIAGALETVLALTVAHVSERSQFGRTLANFQVVQHDLARLGCEVAAAGAAADMATEAFAGDPALAFLPIAAARMRAGEAAGIAAGIAQQLHGAIGFAAEHRLHWFTTALWSWRDEGGGQRTWTDRLGRAALAAGGAGFWSFVTRVA